MKQYRLRTILALWLAATAPMALLAWVVAPLAAGPHPSQSRFAVCLIAALTAGLAWQFVLTMIAVRREGGSIRAALWLDGPSPRRRLWWAIPVTAAVGIVEALPIDFPPPAMRDLGNFLGTPEAHHLYRGNYPLLALTLALFAFNTVLGEELFFRGLLLPRMQDAFGKRSALANAVLFGLYHLHQPWSIPSGIVTGAIQATATVRWRSAWFGIIAHSAQSVLFSVLLTALVLS